MAFHRYRANAEGCSIPCYPAAISAAPPTAPGPSRYRTRPARHPPLSVLASSPPRPSPCRPGDPATPSGSRAFASAAARVLNRRRDVLGTVIPKTNTSTVSRPRSPTRPAAWGEYQRPNETSAHATPGGHSMAISDQPTGSAGAATLCIRSSSPGGPECSPPEAPRPSLPEWPTR